MRKKESFCKEKAQLWGKTDNLNDIRRAQLSNRKTEANINKKVERNGTYFPTGRGIAVALIFKVGHVLDHPVVYL